MHIAQVKPYLLDEVLLERHAVSAVVFVWRLARSTILLIPGLKIANWVAR